MPADKNIKILIVDDSFTMRRFNKNILTKLGFENLLEAQDGTTAIEMLQKETIDLIISDWNMPNMNGLELLKHIRADVKLAHIPFVMVTAEAQQDNILDAIRAKVSQYIVKPFTAEGLSEKLNKIFK